MLTDPLVQAFETASVDPKAFRHREHLYVAWCYWSELSLEEALYRYVSKLRQLGNALGAADKFHATITWAYMVLLSEAMEKSPDMSFDELLTANPQLLDHKSGALAQYYDPKQLASDEARRRFVLPARA